MRNFESHGGRDEDGNPAPDYVLISLDNAKALDELVDLAHWLKTHLTARPFCWECGGSEGDHSDWCDVLKLENTLAQFPTSESVK